MREESITSIGVIAGVIEKDFSQYYDGIMPMLKQIVLHAVSDKATRRVSDHVVSCVYTIDSRPERNKQTII